MGSQGVGKEPEDPRRVEAALRQLYIGTALIGLAVLVYWSIRLILAWWGG